MTTWLMQKTRLTRQELNDQIAGMLFVMPWVLGFLLWTVIPMGSSIYYSFTHYDLLTPPRWAGLVNYTNLFTDADFLLVIKNTAWWVLLSAPLGVISAFLMAVLLNTKIIGRSFFRAIFFFPSIVPAIVITTVFMFLLNIQYGAINSTLKAIGLQTIPFLSSPTWVRPTILLINMWAQGGAMVIFLASLQDVPREMLEAATVDGANAMHKFWYITIPMVSPVILFNTIMAFIGGLQNFELPWLLTQGGPNRATEFFSIFLYRNAFIYLRMGKASALAWVMFIVIVIFTVVLFRSSAKLVYYHTND